MIPDIRFEPLSEDALLLRFGDRIEMAMNARVQAAAGWLQRELPGVECVPAYASVVLRFDPSDWLDRDGGHPHQRLQQAALDVLERDQTESSEAREHVIPVCYGGEYGPDLAQVAEHAGISIDSVIARHTMAEYRVAMLGFAPGFPYLLGLDPTLAMPRRRDPRQRVPIGSVAIGGEQTGIYPQQLPGGWQLIGRTPQQLFDISADPPSLLAAGDRVRFQAIDEERFRQLDAEASR